MTWRDVVHDETVVPLVLAVIAALVTFAFLRRAERRERELDGPAPRARARRRK